MTSDSVTPFRIGIPDSALEELKDRLHRVRLAGRETVPDGSQGVQRERLEELLEYWATGYAWRVLERRLNELGQFRTTIDGLGLHFMHVRSPRPDATPLLLLHGWPGSFLEFLKTVGPLTERGFHLVVPSMPGYGFSGQPASAGWDPDRIARAYGVLMRRLGYGSYLAQGGDWGGVVATRMGAQRWRACVRSTSTSPNSSPHHRSVTTRPQRRRPHSNRAAASSPSMPDTTSCSAPGRRPSATP